MTEAGSGGCYDLLIRVGGEGGVGKCSQEYWGARTAGTEGALSGKGHSSQPKDVEVGGCGFDYQPGGGGAAWGVEGERPTMRGTVETLVFVGEVFGNPNSSGGSPDM